MIGFIGCQVLFARAIVTHVHRKFPCHVEKGSHIGTGVEWSFKDQNSMLKFFLLKSDTESTIRLPNLKPEGCSGLILRGAFNPV